MIIPDARIISDLTNANKANDTNASFNKTITDALNVGAMNKTNSATISFSGKQAMDVMDGLSELKRRGYNVTQTGTNFTITW